MGFILAAFVLAGSGTAFAQTEHPGPGAVEITIIPGGGTFFTEKGSGPSFGNYTLGGSVTYNFNHLVGVEGEIGGTLGLSQDLQFGTINGSVKTPNLVSYSGNVIIGLPTNSAVVPYVTGGIGGTTVLETDALGIADMKTLFTSNVGGGVKWYANKRWGLRADYRFLAVPSTTDAPAFFGRDARCGHRVYGGVIINAVN
ncbi:MAG TPA: outer membrane beta-barrel protein [Vicinamibacterales bacterium]|nr:outer membrane beta-barrel protein [Vicinamibacterales bacterium]